MLPLVLSALVAANCTARTQEHSKGPGFAQRFTYEAILRAKRIAVFSTVLRNDKLFYAVAVAPDDQFGAYRVVLDKIVASCKSTNDSELQREPDAGTPEVQFLIVEEAEVDVAECPKVAQVAPDTH